MGSEWPRVEGSVKGSAGAHSLPPPSHNTVARRHIFFAKFALPRSAKGPPPRQLIIPLCCSHSRCEGSYTACAPHCRESFPMGCKGRHHSNAGTPIAPDCAVVQHSPGRINKSVLYIIPHSTFRVHFGFSQKSHIIMFGRGYFPEALLGGIYVSTMRGFL